MVLIKNNKFPYKIEKRVYKDSFWFKGWFRGLKPEWSNWKLHGLYENIEKIHETLNKLEDKKSYNRFKIEYRIVKNEE